MANPDKITILLGSDGSFQGVCRHARCAVMSVKADFSPNTEGNDAEAARLAVAQNLNIKLFFDDNDTTIAGKPSEYLKGYDMKKTLEGHGLKV